MTRPILNVEQGFDPTVIEKVERLLEVLDTIAANPYLAPRLVLHGGTALNVFHANLPRMSVDIDLAYVGSDEVAVMRRERPSIDAELRRIGSGLGYGMRSLHDEHAGQSYRLTYGTDYIKIDVNYLDRVPLLEPEHLLCPSCRPGVSFAVRPLPELLAGKAGALIDREAPRDLYDIYRLAGDVGAPRLDSGLARGLVVHAVSLTDRFPFERGFTQALERFGRFTRAQEDAVASMLRVGDAPSLDEMRSAVAKYLAPVESPTPAETEYMRLLADEAIYAPQMILPEAVAARAARSPVAKWKVENLRLML